MMCLVSCLALTAVARSQGVLQPGCGEGVLGGCVCATRVLQQRWLGSSARACIRLPAGFWAGGRRAAIALARITLVASGWRAGHAQQWRKRAAPRRFMRWSSPEAPILQFGLLRCTLDAGRADFSRDRRMQSGFFRRISPSSRDCSFRRGRVLKKARSLARGSSQRLPSAGSQSLLSGAIIERASSHRPLGGTQASTEAAPRARHATVWPPRSPR